MIRWVLVMLLSMLDLPAFASEVRDICKSQISQYPSLIYRQKDQNVSAIKSLSKPRTKSDEFLKLQYQKITDFNLEHLENIAVKGNEALIKGSKLRDLFFKYSLKENRLKNPEEFIQTIIHVINEELPSEGRTLSKFLVLKNESIKKTEIRPAGKDDLGEVYGATSRITSLTPSGYKLEIIVSNEQSEPVPYLIPLIVHELKHSESYQERIELVANEKKQTEFLIVDEAKAFDAQMKSYISLIKKDPNLYCNWLYVTWIYGDIVVPLSWTMDNLEDEMLAGKFIVRYAKMGSFEGKDYILNKEKTALRPDLAQKIKSLNLKYIK